MWSDEKSSIGRNTASSTRDAQSRFLSCPVISVENAFAGFQRCTHHE
jgi:hypothetical protein